MPRNRRRLRRPPLLRVRLLPSLRRGLPAPLQRPARPADLTHLALLLPLRPRPARLPPPRLARKRLPVVATRRRNWHPEFRSSPALAATSLRSSERTLEAPNLLVWLVQKFS